MAVKIPIIYDVDTNQLQLSEGFLKRIQKELNLTDVQLEKLKTEFNETGKEVKGTNQEVSNLAGTLGLANTRIGQSAIKAQQLSKSISAVGKSTNFFTGALGKLKIALLATGIGALIVALGAVYTFLTKTQRGLDLMGVQTAKLSAATDVLRDRLSILGEKLISLNEGTGRSSQVFNTLKKIFIDMNPLVLIFKATMEELKFLFPDITKEIEEEAKKAGELQERMNNLKDAEIAYIEEREKRLNQISELRLAAKDENLEDAKRLEFLKEALKIQQEVTAQEVKFAKERADILTEQVALGESTREEEQAAAEARANVIRVQAESLDRQRTIQSEILGLSRRLGRQNKDTTKTIDEQRKAIDELRKSSKLWLEQFGKIDAIPPGLSDLEQALLQFTDRLFGGPSKLEEKAKEFQTTIGQAIKARAQQVEDTKQKNQEELDQEKEFRQQLRDTAIEGFVDIENTIFELRQNNLQRQLDQLEQSYQTDLLLAGENADAKKAIEDEYANKIRELRTKQAKNEKAQAIFESIINTARAVIAALPNIPLSIAIGAIGATKTALIASQSIPRFHTGKKRVEKQNGNSEVLSILKENEMVFDVPTTNRYAPALDAIFDHKIHPDIINSFVQNQSTTKEFHREVIKDSVQFNFDSHGMQMWKRIGDSKFRKDIHRYSMNYG